MVPVIIVSLERKEGNRDDSVSIRGVWIMDYVVMQYSPFLSTLSIWRKEGRSVACNGYSITGSNNPLAM